MQPQPCLSHMPYFIKTQIVESLPMQFRERTPVRMLSKTFKEIVDSSNMRMSLTINLMNPVIVFEHETRVFFTRNNHTNGCIVSGKQLSDVPGNVEDVAFEYLTFFTSKPKLIFEKLQIINFETNEDFEITRFVRNFQEFFSSRQLKAQSFTLETLLKTERDIMSFVPYLDHEILVSIDLLKGGMFALYRELPETVQWKNLQELAAHVSVLSTLSFDSYCHIPRLAIHLSSGHNNWSQWTISFYKHFMYANSALESASIDAALFNQVRFDQQLHPDVDWTFQAHKMNWLIVDKSKKLCLCFNYDNYPNFEVKKWTWEELTAIEENDNDN